MKKYFVGTRFLTNLMVTELSLTPERVYQSSAIVEAKNPTQALKAGATQIYSIPDRFLGADWDIALSLCNELGFRRSCEEESKTLFIEKPSIEAGGWRFFVDSDWFTIYAVCDGVLFERLEFGDRQDFFLDKVREIIDRQGLGYTQLTLEL